MQDEANNVLESFRQGKPGAFDDAFATLFRQHQRSVYGWLLRIVRNQSAAEDLTVETFWRIYRSHARFIPSRGFEPWARTIATHAAIDWLRRQHPMDELPPDLPAPAQGDPALAAEIRQLTAEAFARLPARLRVTAILAVVEELPHKEIAATLGITVAAVKLRVFRAMRQLRTDLRNQGITP